MCDKSPSGRFYIPSTRKVVSRKDAVYYKDHPGCKHEPVGRTKLMPTAVENNEQTCLSIDLQPNQKKAKPEAMITAKDAHPEAICTGKRLGE